MATVTKAPSVYGEARCLDIEVGSSGYHHSPESHTYQIAIGGSKKDYIVCHNTLSLIGGVCTPGCHPGYSQYFKRRVRMSSDSELVELCKSNGYHVEYQRNFDKTIDHTTMIVTFPCMYPKGTLCAKDITALQQLEIVMQLQQDWSDNAVSCTVYYKKEELQDIREFLIKHYSMKFKSVSFLLHNDHGFDQAPYEEITEDEYNNLIKGVKSINSKSIMFSKDDDEIASESTCVGGACPIK